MYKSDTGVPLLTQIKYVYLNRDSKLECYYSEDLLCTFRYFPYIFYRKEKKKKKYEKKIFLSFLDERYCMVNKHQVCDVFLIIS